MPSSQRPGEPAQAVQPEPKRKNLLHVSTTDAGRARCALAALHRALAEAGIDGIYKAFMLDRAGNYWVWVATCDGSPVPGSDAWVHPDAAAADRETGEAEAPLTR